jgi:hypothetical protein
MSDPDPDDPSNPAAKRPTRSFEASRRLSQLLSRPFGTPAAPGETVEPLPRVVRPAPVPEAAPAPPDHTASPPPPPAAAAADPEPHLPWFDRPGEPPATSAPAAVPEPPVSSAETASDVTAPPAPTEPPPNRAAEHDDDLFARRDPPPRHEPAAPADEDWPRPAARDLDERPPHGADKVPEWAWPSALDRAPEAAPAALSELRGAPEPLVAPATVPRARAEAPAAAPPAAGRPLDPDATRTLGNIRRLMLISNLFMVVAIGAVLVVVGYRLFRSEPAPPPPLPPPAARPAPATIPNDMTLTLPRGARIVQTAIAGDRLVITLQIDGATEIRTFDIKTLQPTGRLNFGTVP